MSDDTKVVGEKEGLKFFGLPWWFCLAAIVIVLGATSTGALTSELAGSFALMLAIGIVCNEIGERIPIWNSYIGGGLVLSFLVSAFLFTNHLIPKKYAAGVDLIMGGKVDFLSFFIIFLITGSILALDRKLLLRSFAGYIPAIFGGLIGAAILGIAGGFIFGIEPKLILLNYVLPIMGGGNGAGAVPLSQIYETVTGDKAANYYTFAITILTIANIFAIMTAAVLNKIGEVKPAWTGDHTTLMRKGVEVGSDQKLGTPTVEELGGAFFMTLAFLALGRFFGKTLFPKILGVAIHPFAWMICFVAIAAATGIVPPRVRAASKRLQSFFTKNMVLIIMVGVGADTNLNDLIAAINPSNVVIAFLIVVGAIIGSAVVGHLVGFFPIDSAITAGLCMANRGGSGDLAVLGASRRMGLIAYAQLSSRLGGGIVLVIGSILFGTFIGGK
jgi:Na+/citrate or Na+/malate symporter